MLKLGSTPKKSKDQSNRTCIFSYAPPFGRFSELQSTKNSRNPLINNGTENVRMSQVSPLSPLIDENVYPDLDDDIDKLSVLMTNYLKRLDNVKPKK